MQVKARGGTALEKAPQQAEGFGERTQVPNDHPQSTLFAHRQLRRVGLQLVEIPQEDPRAVVKRASNIGQRNPIRTTVQQSESYLTLELLDRCEYRWL